MILLQRHNWSSDIAMKMQRDVRESGKAARKSLSSYVYFTLCSIPYETLTSCIIVTSSCVNALEEMTVPHAVIHDAPCPLCRNSSRFLPVVCPCYVPFNAPLQCSYSMLQFKCANSMRQRCASSMQTIVTQRISFSFCCLIDGGNGRLSSYGRSGRWAWSPLWLCLYLDHVAAALWLRVCLGSWLCGLRLGTALPWRAHVGSWYVARNQRLQHL